MEWRSVSKIVALAFAVPATAVLLYWLILRKDDDDDNDDPKSGKVDTSRHTVIQVSVPSKVVGAVIGLKGANIKKIQEESGAKVSFSDRESDEKDDEDRIVFIRGDRESAQKAEILIRQVIADMPTEVTEQVLVPGYCLGRLIGRGGETIRGLSRSSRCKIFIDRSQDSQGRELPRCVSITGPHTHVPLAKAMIEEKVAEEEEFRAKKAVTGDNREQRKGGKKEEEYGKERVPLPSTVVEEDKSWDSGDHRSRQVPSMEPVQEFMQVFVSAVEHVGHFWVQIVNNTALNLDKMSDDMNVFYSNPETTEQYKLAEVKEGDIIAAPFFEDKSWYRARVEGFEDGKVDLYFFDFGDNGLAPLEDLRELKPDYLTLPVQAIECKLANVQPVGEAWSEESSEAFEELTHCAEWKVLVARTVGYMPLASGQRPCLQLIDNAEEPPMDMAAELVSRGLAAWASPPSSPPSSTASAPMAPSDTVRADLVRDPCPS